MMVIRRQVDYERFVLEGDGSGVVDGVFVAKWPVKSL